MALYSVDHAVGIARDLADELSLRLANAASGINFVRQAQTTSATPNGQGWPMLFLSVNGNEAEGAPVIVIRLMNINVGAVDVFGNPTLPFTPTQCEVAYELASSGAPIPSIANLVTAFFQVTRTGVIVENEPIANGTAVNEASMNAVQAAGGPAQVLKDIDWRNSGNT